MEGGLEPLAREEAVLEADCSALIVEGVSGAEWRTGFVARVIQKVEWN